MRVPSKISTWGTVTVVSTNVSDPSTSPAAFKSTSVVSALFGFPNTAGSSESSIVQFGSSNLTTSPLLALKSKMASSSSSSSSKPTKNVSAPFRDRPRSVLAAMCKSHSTAQHPSYPRDRVRSSETLILITGIDLVQFTHQGGELQLAKAYLGAGAVGAAAAFGKAFDIGAGFGSQIVTD